MTFWNSWLQVLFQASLYLEALAFLPQLVLGRRIGTIDTATRTYISMLGVYRALYVVNWVHRYYTEPYFVHWLRALLLSALCRPACAPSIALRNAQLCLS